MKLPQLEKLVVSALEDIKGKDIEVINTAKLTPLFERIIIASGDSNRQVRSLANNVEEKVREAGEVMTEIVGAIQRVTHAMTEIAEATRQQSMGIGHVSQSIHELDQMTQQNAALVEESAAAADSLRQQASDLSRAVQRFHIESVTHGAIQTAA